MTDTQQDWEKNITQACYEYENGELGKHKPFIRNLFKDLLKQRDEELVAETRDNAFNEVFNTLKVDKEISRPLPDPIDAILFVMEQRELTKNDMIPYFGNQSKVSEVLNKVRPLSKTMIRRLMAGLDISAEVLIQDYQLKSGKAIALVREREG